MKTTTHTRYLPTVYVDQATETRLLTGSLILQPGQWIILATSGRRARWAGVSAGGTLTIQHHKHRLGGYPLDGLRRLINFANACDPGPEIDSRRAGGA